MEGKGLKPCPFKNDGKAHTPKIVTAMGEAWVMCTCGVSGEAFSGIDAEKRAANFWNERRERTCIYERCDHDLICSDCGWNRRGALIYPNYCPNCGAKVLNAEEENERFNTSK